MASFSQMEELMKKVKVYLEKGMEVVTDVAQDVAESNDGGEKVKELEDIMLQYGQMDGQLKHFMAALQFTKSQTEPGDNLVEVLNNKYKDLCESNTDDMRKNEKYIEMQEKIWEIQHPGEPLPTQVEPSQNSDDDMILTQQDVNTRCPYLAREMVHPMKNKICGHHIDREGLQALLTNRRGHANKCPVGGCTNAGHITSDDYEEDYNLKRLIDRKNRGQGKKTKRS